MIKHAAILGTLVALLVGGLVYCISPGELQTVWSIARNRISTEAGEVLEATLHRGTKIIDRARAEPAPSRTGRNMRPDPFRPFGPRPASAASGFWIWLKGPQPVAVWISILAIWLAHRYVRKRRFRLAMEERMAISCSKAVRQM